MGMLLTPPYGSLGPDQRCSQSQRGLRMPQLDAAYIGAMISATDCFVVAAAAAAATPVAHLHVTLKSTALLRTDMCPLAPQTSPFRCGTCALDRRIVPVFQMQIGNMTHVLMRKGEALVPER